MSRLSCTVGLLYRRDFRRALQRLGLDFVEERGLLDSHFTITGPSDRLRALQCVLREAEL